MNADRFAIQRAACGDYLTEEPSGCYGWCADYNHETVVKFYTLEKAVALKRTLPAIGDTLLIARLPIHGAGKCG